MRCHSISGRCGPTFQWHFFNSAWRNSFKGRQQNYKNCCFFLILKFQLIYAFCSPLFDVLYLLQIILALNRLVIAVKTINSPLTASNQSKAEQYFFNVTLNSKISSFQKNLMIKYFNSFQGLFAATIGVYVAKFSICLSPLCGAVWDENYFFWRFNPHFPLSIQIFKIGITIQFYMAIFVFGLYLLIIALIRLVKFSILQLNFLKSFILKFHFKI